MEFVLVCRIIHADRLTGGTAFWMSRPISRLFLFESKGIGIALLVGTPLCVFRLFSDEMVPVELELGVAAFFILLAAITSTLVQAIAAAVALFIAAAIGFAIIGTASPQASLSMEVALGIAIPLWALVVTLCFISRRRVIPWAIVLASPLLISLTWCLLDAF